MLSYEGLAKLLKPDCHASLAMTISPIYSHCEEERRSNPDLFGTFAGTSYIKSYSYMRKKIKRLIKFLLPYKPDRLYLFGSWAREEEDELSDMDIVVIKQTPSPFFKRLQEVSRFLPEDIGGVDILVYTPEEFKTMQMEGNAFAEMIAEEAKLIYDRQTPSRS